MMRGGFLNILRRVYLANYCSVFGSNLWSQKNAVKKCQPWSKLTGCCCKPAALSIAIVLCKQLSNEEIAASLEHDFLIRQATTVNVNAATQLLTVTLIAIKDTSDRLRDALSKEICLVKQAMEWGDEGTPPHHWDQLVAVRGLLCDLKHNLRILTSYMEYAEKLATVAAEISYLSGNVAASDAICERIDQACRACKTERQLIHVLQQESLELQQKAIVNSPQIEEKLKCCSDLKCDQKLSELE